MNKVIFLDRDGTINIDKEYIHKIEDFEFIPNAIEGLKLLQKQGYKLVIVTNQSGIGRGYYTKDDYNLLERHINNELKKEKIKIEKTFHCPHISKEGCLCRKPNVGMVKEYIEKNKIDTHNSYVIGDKTSDIKFGENLNIKTILLKTGKGGSDGKYKTNPNYVGEDLLDAARFIVKNERV